MSERTEPAWKRALFWVGFGVLVLVIVSALLRGKAGLPEGIRAPELSAVGADGPVDLARDRGKLVVLNFWASWCPPCRAEAPVLARAHRTLARAGGLVLGIAVNSGSPADATRAARSLGMSYPIAVADAQSLDRYRVQSLPTTYVLSPSGRIARGFVGELDDGRLGEAIRAARALDASPARSVRSGPLAPLLPGYAVR